MRWTILNLILITGCGDWSLAHQAENSRSSGPKLRHDARAVIQLYSDALAEDHDALGLTENSRFTEAQILDFEAEFAKLIVKVLDNQASLIAIHKAANRNVFRAAKAAELKLTPRTKAVLCTLPFRTASIPEKDMKEELARNLEVAELTEDLDEFIVEAQGLIPAKYADEFPESIVEANQIRGVAPEKTIKTLIKGLAKVSNEALSKSLDSTVKMIAKKELPAVAAAELYIEMRNLEVLKAPQLQSSQEVDNALNSAVNYVSLRWQAEQPEGLAPIPSQISQVLDGLGGSKEQSPPPSTPSDNPPQSAEPVVVPRQSIPAITSPVKWLPLTQDVAMPNIALQVSAGTNGGETRCEGRLPPGLVVNPVSCVISGTPTQAAARAAFVVMVSNQHGLSAQVTIEITVGSDPCPGTAIKTQEIRYKDDDNDGYFVASLFPVCANNRTFPIAASALTGNQRRILDIDRDRVADSDNDSVSDLLDQCPNEDDLVARQAYLDQDGDGLVTRTGSLVCSNGAGDHVLLASSLSTYQINHFDEDDATPVRNWNDLQITESDFGADLNDNGNAQDADEFYVIANPHQLLDAANNCTSGTRTTCDKNFLIVSDLDFGDVDGTWNDMHPGDGAYTTNKRRDVFNGSNLADLFTGVINGLGRSISNFHLLMISDNLGLIGAAGDGVKIIDLNFSGSINSRGGSSVGLIGHLEGAATLVNVHIDMEIDGQDQVGGLIGSVSANAGTLSVRNASVRGTILGHNVVGGLVGFAGSDVTLTESFNLARVRAWDGDAAGIVGSSEADTIITRSFNDGDIFSAGHAAGILTGSGAAHTRTFRDVYNSGDIESSAEDHYVSGIAADASRGASYHIFDRVYNVGDLNSPNGWVFGVFEGYLGFSDALANDTIYLARRAELLFSQIGSSVAAAELMKRSSFPSWDFESIWAIQEDSTAPYLVGVTPGDRRPSSFD